MLQDDFKALVAFVQVARERSFTKASSKLGLSPSAVSHSMKALESRLGVRLLARTTRSVAATTAGERLLATLGPALSSIDATLEELSSMRNTPAGTVRITALKHAAKTVLWPALPSFLREHPDVRVEIVIDNAFTDIVAGQFDAGVRFGESVEKDMIAVRLGPDIPIACVGAPAYFAKHPAPRTPHDLAAHACINYRLPGTGGIYAWEFVHRGRTLHVKVAGPLVFNDGDLILDAALDGVGLACFFDDEVRQHIDAGRLERVLTRWCPTFRGYHLYYPSRRQTPPALAALVKALRPK